jgi:hypothetical protein
MAFHHFPFARLFQKEEGEISADALLKRKRWRKKADFSKT